MTSKYPSDHQDKFTIRFNDGLKNKVVLSAKANNCSINTEINTRLELSLLAEQDSTELLTAEQAKDMMLKARKDRVNIMLKKCMTEINQHIQIGVNYFYITFEEYDGYWEEDDPIMIEVILPVFNRLKELGFNVEIDNDAFAFNI